MSKPWLDRYVTLNNLAQGFHFLLSAFVVEHGSRWVGHPVIWLVAVLVFWAIKEGYLDKKWESPEVSGSGWLDFASGALGAAVGYWLA